MIWGGLTTISSRIRTNSPVVNLMFELLNCEEKNVKLFTRITTDRSDMEYVLGVNDTWRDSFSLMIFQDDKKYFSLKVQRMFLLLLLLLYCVCVRKINYFHFYHNFFVFYRFFLPKLKCTERKNRIQRSQLETLVPMTLNWHSPIYRNTMWKNALALTNANLDVCHLIS